MSPSEVAIDAAGSPVALVFKTRVDDFLGADLVLKVLSGTIRANDTLVNTRTGDKDRLHNLMKFTGAEHRSVDHAAAGDIVAATKLGDVRTGDTLADDTALTVFITPPPAPVYGGGHPCLGARAGGQAGHGAAPLRGRGSEPRDPSGRHHPPDGALGRGEAHIRVVRARLKRMGIDFEVEGMKICVPGDAGPAGRRGSQAQETERRARSVRGGDGAIRAAAAGRGYEFDTEVSGGAIPGA